METELSQIQPGKANARTSLRGSGGCHSGVSTLEIIVEWSGHWTINQERKTRCCSRISLYIVCARNARIRLGVDWSCLAAEVNARSRILSRPCASFVLGNCSQTCEECLVRIHYRVRDNIGTSRSDDRHNFSIPDTDHQ